MSNYKFQVGDKVTVRDDAKDFWSNCADANRFRISAKEYYLLLTRVGNIGDFKWECYDLKGTRCNYCGGHDLQNDDFILINKQTNNMPKLLNKFQNIFLQEPEKSFRKAGITGEDGMLTDEGQEVFLTWLLKKNGDAFKTEVVEPILADQKDEK